MAGRDAPNRDTPYVEHGVLHVPDTTGEIEQTIRVDSAAWFEWLHTARRFYVKHEAGNFYCRKERRDRGGAYWLAYRRRGVLRKRYVGRDHDVSMLKLNGIAAELTVAQHEHQEAHV